MIVEHMDNCLDRVPMSDLDAAALYELALCMKYVMRLPEGLAAAVGTRGALDAIVLALDFEFKLLAMEVSASLAHTLTHSLTL